MRELEPIELSQEEGAAMFDRLAQERLGISGEEFAVRFANGEFHDDEPHMVELAILSPLAGGDYQKGEVVVINS